MSKLNIEQKNIRLLFTEHQPNFLIPDYQRPYAWGQEECQTLWDDIYNFAFPDGNTDNFDSEDEYFLGPIVTFKNADGKLEIIDGQQRLTTLMLLLRAFYARFADMLDEDSKRVAERLAECIWRTDEFGNSMSDQLKIDSEVATDDDKTEFLSILRTGKVPEEMKSNYAENYRFFEAQIATFLEKQPSYCNYLPARIMNNCILLPIEAESQNTALRIFSTLNDRGLPLSDSDIFKAQLYKFYTNKGEHDHFIERWKRLDGICDEVFHPKIGVPMDDLFTRYMYFERAKLGIRSSTTQGLRDFYENSGKEYNSGTYGLLRREETLDSLEVLADFWQDVMGQSNDRFDVETLRWLFILNYAPNGMWTYITSVYFLQYRNTEGDLENKLFSDFLQKITAFIWAYAITNPGVNALRTPIFTEMIHIVNSEPVTFSEWKFDAEALRRSIENYIFSNNRQITRSMLTWWAFSNPQQELAKLSDNFEIEHIYPRNRQNNEHGLEVASNLESLGNKVLLEKRINIRASDYRFADKKKYYTGFQSSRGYKKPTKIHELLELAKQDDFKEADIKQRKKLIIDSFIKFVRANQLLQ